MAGNLSIFKCVNFGNKFTALDKEGIEKQEPLLNEMANIWESNSNLKKLGINKNSDEMIERWLGAGLADPFMFEISKGDLSIFRDHVNLTGKMMYEKGFGFNSPLASWKILRTRIRYLPGGENLGKEMEEILSFQRKHRESNQNNYNIINKRVKGLTELFGVDISKLARLEDAYLKTQDPVKRDEILNGKGGIKEYLGEMTSAETNTTAGEMLNGIRDIMEGTLVGELTYTNKDGKIVPWTGEMKKNAIQIKNSYYDMRSDLLEVALSSLHRLKSNAKRLDAIEGGRRGLYEFIEKIDSKIKQLETTKDAPLNQENRSKITGLTKFGLDKDIYLEHRKGYSPHVVLQLLKVTGEFNDFMKSEGYANKDGSLRTATTEFAETLDWLNKHGNIKSNLKTRRDGNEEYFSRNPSFFLGKYVHDISKMNHDVMTQDIVQKTFAELLKVQDYVEGKPQKERVEGMIHLAIENLKDVMQESDIISGSSKQSKRTKGKLARTLQSLGFINALAFKTANTVKNYAGARLMNYMENGQRMILANKKYYNENPQAAEEVLRELDKHGYTWANKDTFIQSLHDIWKNPEVARKLSKIGGGAATAGTLEEGGFEAMGIKPKFNKNGQVEGYELIDANLLEKAVNTIEAIAGGSSAFQTVVENWVRPDVFKGTFATIYENMQSLPEGQKLYLMNKTKDNYINNKQQFDEMRFRKDFNNFTRRSAGSEAHAAVNATQFEYAKVSKAPVMKGGKGSTILQFMHYQLSYQDWMWNTFRNGKRSVKAAFKTKDISRMTDQSMYKAYRYAMARQYAWMATMVTGLGFTNWVVDPTIEFIQQHITMLNADIDTEEGREEFERASFGMGASKNLGISFNTAHKVADIFGVDFGSPNSKIFYKSPDPNEESTIRKSVGAISSAAENLIYEDIPDLTWKGNAGRAFLRNTSLWMDEDANKSYRGLWEPIEPVYKDLFGIEDKTKGKYYKVNEGFLGGEIYKRDPDTGRRIKIKEPPEYGFSNKLYKDNQGFIKRRVHKKDPVAKIRSNYNTGNNPGVLNKIQKKDALSALDQIK